MCVLCQMLYGGLNGENKDLLLYELGELSAQSVNVLDGSCKTKRDVNCFYVNLNWGKVYYLVIGIEE